jgi:hypothetical protein
MVEIVNAVKAHLVKKGRQLNNPLGFRAELLSGNITRADILGTPKVGKTSYLKLLDYLAIKESFSEKGDLA